MTGTDLQTTGTQGLATQWCEPELPERLASLVSAALPDRMPSLDLGEVATATAALAVYDQYPRGTPPRQVNKMLTRLSMAYPSLKLSDAEAAARMELYGEMLSDIDTDLLAAGFREAVKTCKFYPSVSELRGLALSQPATPRMIRANRLRAMLRAQQAEEAPIEIVTPEQIAAIKAELGLEGEAAARLDRIVGSEAA